jgi:hypothetical protein
VKPGKDAIEIKSMRLSYAGAKTVDNQTNTFGCKVLATSYISSNPDNSRTDVAILECSSHEAGVYLHLSDSINELQPGAVVDIIGYPCYFTKDQENQFQEKGELRCYDESMKEAGKMLPPKTLTVSRGSVEEIQKGLIRYKISTLPGMSGACLMYNGKVYGSS